MKYIIIGVTEPIFQLKKNHRHLTLLIWVQQHRISLHTLKHKQRTRCWSSIDWAPVRVTQHSACIKCNAVEPSQQRTRFQKYASLPWTLWYKEYVFHIKVENIRDDLTNVLAESCNLMHCLPSASLITGPRYVAVIWWSLVKCAQTALRWLLV